MDGQKDTTLTFRLTVSMKRQLASEADRDQRTASQHVRHIIEEWYRRQRKRVGK